GSRSRRAPARAPATRRAGAPSGHEDGGGPSHAPRPSRLLEPLAQPFRLRALRIAGEETLDGRALFPPLPELAERPDLAVARFLSQRTALAKVRLERCERRLRVTELRQLDLAERHQRRARLRAPGMLREELAVRARGFGGAARDAE